MKDDSTFYSFPDDLNIKCKIKQMTKKYKIHQNRELKMTLRLQTGTKPPLKYQPLCGGESVGGHGAKGLWGCGPVLWNSLALNAHLALLFLVLHHLMKTKLFR